jgi:hypothetical protein
MSTTAPALLWPPLSLHGSHGAPQSGLSLLEALDVLAVCGEAG